MTHINLKYLVAIPIIILAIFAMAPRPASADEIYTFVVKKQEEKAKSRWTLQEWLETRDRMRLMDLWLALHSPSPYEFYVGGDYTQSVTGPSGKNGQARLQIGAFASIFGLEYLRTWMNANETQGLFMLRLFGHHAQATNLTLNLGVRSLDGVPLRNALAGVSLSIYLGKYFGLDGLYRYHFGSVPNDAGIRLTQQQLEGGAFMEFKYLRLFGSYYWMPGNLFNQSGFRAGTRFYF